MKIEKETSDFTDGGYIHTFTDILDKKVLVVGDCHGCYFELLELLKLTQIIMVKQNNIIFNKNVIVILLGDVVAKGPSSEKLIELVKAHPNYIFPLKGNHEDKWIKEEKIYSDFIKTWPYAIRLPEFRVVCVHAGIDSTKQLNETDPKIFTCTSTKWIKRYFGPYKILFGHHSELCCSFKSPAVNITYFRNSICLDTGCVYGYKLSSILLTISKYHQIRLQSYQVKSRYNCFKPI